MLVIYKPSSNRLGTAGAPPPQNLIDLLWGGPAALETKLHTQTDSVPVMGAKDT